MSLAIKPRHTRASQRAFTLIEVMIVVAIIALLAAIALPSYREQMAKGRRGEAAAALLAGAQALERYYSANGSYLNGGNIASVFPTQVPATGTAYYTIAAVALNTGANKFQLQATATGIMNGDACGNFLIDQAGVKDLNGNTKTVDDCWRR